MFLFSFLTLPLRIASNLFRMAVRALWLPIHIVTHNLFLVMILVLVLVIYLQFKQTSPSTRASSPAQSSANSAAKSSPLLVEPVSKKEDGDSSFATDIYATMTEPERTYYTKIFFWAMTNLQDTQVHSWNNMNIAGSIRPNDTFTNKLGVRCRHFSEVLKVHRIEQTLSGTVCEKGDGSWCKLKPNATPACNLGHKTDMLESIRALF